MSRSPRPETIGPRGRDPTTLFTGPCASALPASFSYKTDTMACTLEAKRFLLLAVGISCLFLVVMAGCASESAKERFEEAEASLSEGRFYEAMEKYSYVADNFQDTPYAPRSLYRVAFIYNRHLKDRREAVNSYYRLYSIHPTSPESMLARKDLAEIYSESGDHAKAVEQYQWLLEKSPGEGEHYKYLIAMEYLKMTDLRQARVELKELLEFARDPDITAKAHFQRANTYYIEGDLARAIEGFRETERKFPDHEVALQALFNMAKALEESGRLKEALAVLEGIKDTYPNKPAVESSIEWIEKRLKKASAEDK